MKIMSKSVALFVFFNVCLMSLGIETKATPKYEVVVGAWKNGRYANMEHNIITLENGSEMDEFVFFIPREKMHVSGELIVGEDKAWIISRSQGDETRKPINISKVETNWERMKVTLSRPWGEVPPKENDVILLGEKPAPPPLNAKFNGTTYHALMPREDEIKWQKIAYKGRVVFTFKEDGEKRTVTHAVQAPFRKDGETWSLELTNPNNGNSVTANDANDNQYVFTVKGEKMVVTYDGEDYDMTPDEPPEVKWADANPWKADKWPKFEWLEFSEPTNRVESITTDTVSGLSVKQAPGKLVLWDGKKEFPWANESSNLREKDEKIAGLKFPPGANYIVFWKNGKWQKFSTNRIQEEEMNNENPPPMVEKNSLLVAGGEVKIQFFHTPVYPANGKAGEIKSNAWLRAVDKNQNVKFYPTPPEWKNAEAVEMRLSATSDMLHIKMRTGEWWHAKIEWKPTPPKPDYFLDPPGAPAEFVETFANNDNNWATCENAVITGQSLVLTPRADNGVCANLPGWYDDFAITCEVKPDEVDAGKSYGIVLTDKKGMETLFGLTHHGEWFVVSANKETQPALLPEIDNDKTETVEKQEAALMEWRKNPSVPRVEREGNQCKFYVGGSKEPVATETVSGPVRLGLFAAERRVEFTGCEVAGKAAALKQQTGPKNRQGVKQ